MIIEWDAVDVAMDSTDVAWDVAALARGVVTHRITSSGLVRHAVHTPANPPAVAWSATLPQLDEGAISPPTECCARRSLPYDAHQIPDVGANVMILAQYLRVVTYTHTHTHTHT
jgi:hypothetical protein